MQHHLDQNEEGPQGIDSDILEELSRRYPSYVVVTAGLPNEEGKLDVQLSYQGDPWLARYLVDGVTDVLDQACMDADEQADSAFLS